MKKRFLISTQMLIVASLLMPGLTAQEFKADLAKTNLTWEGKGVGKSHTGTVKLKAGTLMLKAGIPDNGLFVFDMTSLVNTDLSGNMADRLIGHLASDDFFGVETYPEVKFKVLGSKALDGGKLLVKGELTIKGKTNPIEFTSEVMKSGDSYMFKGSVEVDRSLFDVKYGSGKFFENLGDKAINDIFTLDFDLYVNLPK